MILDFERVQAEVFRLHAAGRYREALDVVGVLSEEHAAKAAFWRACLLARAGDADAALGELEESVDAGHWYADLDDDDLASLRDDARFAAVVAANAASRERYRPGPGLVVIPPATRERKGTLVAFHRASGTPERSRSHWEPAARAGWRVALPLAEHALESDSHLWLDRGLERLDIEAIRRVGRAALAQLGEEPPVLAGFSQGAAAALLLACDGLAPAVLVVGSSLRYAEAVPDAIPADLRAHFVLGGEELRVEAAREAAASLAAQGAHVTVDVRPGHGHMFPESFAAELPGLLDVLSPPPPLR